MRFLTSLILLPLSAVSMPAIFAQNRLDTLEILPSIESMHPAGSSLPDKAISIDRLNQTLSPKAAKELKAARKALKGGSLALAIEHMTNVAELEPSAADVWNDLGTLHLRGGAALKAVECFEKAIKANSSAPGGYLNLSFANLALERPQPAENAARKAVALAPRRPDSSYVLAMSLVRGGQYTDEALSRSRLAEAAYPEAKLLAVEVLYRQGKLGDARSAAQAYLDSGNPVAHSEAEDWVRILSRRASTGK